MTDKITLATLANLENETTAVNAINSNFAIIETAMNNTLSRDGTTPNQMNAALDMNSFPIQNLPAPGTANSPARLVDVTSTNPISISLSLSGDITAPASSGVLTTTINKTPTSGNLLLANGTTWSSTPMSGAITINSSGATTLGSNTVSSSNIVNNTIVNADLRQSAALSVIGNTSNATANVADITGTARQVLAVNTAGTSLVFAQPRGDQLLGTATNDNATTGNVGELLTASVAQGSAVGLSNGVAANVTSLPITAGDWDLWANVYWSSAASTTVTALNAFLTATSGSTGTSPLGGFINHLCASFTPNSSFIGGYTVGPIRLSLAGTQTWFLVTSASFAVAALSAYGIINARRIR